jgi:hypothetical protein
MSADITVQPKPDRRRLLPLLQIAPVACPLCGGIETTWAAHETGVRFHCDYCRQALSADEFREKTSEVTQAQREQHRAWDKICALLNGQTDHRFIIEQ